MQQTEIFTGTPKWMVYKGNPIKMDDLGVPLLLETPTKFHRLTNGTTGHFTAAHFIPDPIHPGAHHKPTNSGYQT